REHMFILDRFLAFFVVECAYPPEANMQKNWNEIVGSTIARYRENAQNPEQASPWGEEGPSKAHFARKFKELSGETPFSFQRRLRLERGVWLLRNSGLRICDIASECGYESQEAFAKAVKKEFGLTPRQMRRLPTWSGGLFSPIHYHYDEEECADNWVLLQEKGGIAMNMKIVHLEPFHVISLASGGDYWGMPKTWQRFHQIIGGTPLAAQAESYLSVFHDHHRDIPMEQKKWDTGIIVKQKMPLPEELRFSTLAGGLYAVYLHFGPCEEIGPAWEEWTKGWLPQSPYEIDASRPSLEWYQNNLPFLPPELHVTFLCDPVRNKNG
ncbi:MAG TPA: AraC family transcriptional regulator, partial [Thermotogota bacterium]|nr:AraC family transcriptional regulator [Thermotogota bacterium]